MEPIKTTSVAADLTLEPEQEAKWRWRNCRSLAFGFELWLWPWNCAWGSDADVYGGQSYLAFGPLVLSIKYNIGNSSADWPSCIGALSEVEAWERALH